MNIETDEYTVDQNTYRIKQMIFVLTLQIDILHWVWVTENLQETLGQKKPKTYVVVNIWLLMIDTHIFNPILLFSYTLWSYSIETITDLPSTSNSSNEHTITKWQIRTTNAHELRQSFLKSDPWYIWKTIWILHYKKQ